MIRLGTLALYAAYGSNMELFRPQMPLRCARHPSGRSGWTRAEQSSRAGA